MGRWAVTVGTVRPASNAVKSAEAGCDVIAVIFTGHEATSPHDRAPFFAEVTARCGPAGPCSSSSTCATPPIWPPSAPGLAALAGLRVARESRITPWVLALALEKARRQVQVRAHFGGQDDRELALRDLDLPEGLLEEGVVRAGSRREESFSVGSVGAAQKRSGGGA